MAVVDTLRNCRQMNIAAELMTLKADNLKILGAAVISVYECTNREVEGETITEAKGINSGEHASKLSRKPNREPGDPGTDYLGLAHAKKSRRLRMETANDIEDPAVRRGEDPATGDEAIKLGTNLIIITAFSGARTPEQDRQIAEFGMALILNSVLGRENYPEYDNWFDEHPNQTKMR